MKEQITALQVFLAKHQLLYFAIPVGFILIGIIIMLFALQKPISQQQTVTPSSTPAPTRRITPRPTAVTSSSENITKEEELELQAAAEENTKRIEKEFYQTYPWYDELPLQTNKYFVYLDIPKDQLVGLLYPQINSSISIPDQVSAIKIEVLNQLQRAGVNTTDYPVEWRVTPK